MCVYCLLCTFSSLFTLAHLAYRLSVNCHFEKRNFLFIAAGTTPGTLAWVAVHVRCNA